MTHTLLALALSAGVAGAPAPALVLGGALEGAGPRPDAAYGARPGPLLSGRAEGPRLLDVALDPGPGLGLGGAPPAGALGDGGLAARPEVDLGAALAAASSRRDDTGAMPARAAVACFAGFIFPGLGHALSGTYLYRGLAFTAAFLASVVGAATFLVQADAHPELAGPLGTGGLVLMATAEVVWVWSGIDALFASSHPPETRRPRPVRLGVD